MPTFSLDVVLTVGNRGPERALSPTFGWNSRLVSATVHPSRERVRHIAELRTAVRLNTEKIVPRSSSWTSARPPSSRSENATVAPVLCPLNACRSPAAVLLGGIGRSLGRRLLERLGIISGAVAQMASTDMCATTVLKSACRARRKQYGTVFYRSRPAAGRTHIFCPYPHFPPKAKLRHFRFSLDPALCSQKNRPAARSGHRSPFRRTVRPGIELSSARHVITAHRSGPMT